MNPLAILEECEREGVRLFVADSRLRFRCPRGKMTDALRDLLREHRKALPATIRAMLLERLADFDKNITHRMPRDLRHDPRFLRLADDACSAVRSCDSVKLDDVIRAIEQLVADTLDAMADRGPDIWPSLSDRPAGPKKWHEYKPFDTLE